MFQSFIAEPPVVWLVASAVVMGLAVGRLIRWWVAAMLERRVTAGFLFELATAVLFAAYVFAYLQLGCQQIPEVLPDPHWRMGRLASHLILLTLLIAATGTDLRDYVIPDAITLPGTLIGLTAATISGDLQINHLWVDWNQAVPGLAGPYIPEWIKQSPHWHGLAWSLAGAAAGGGVTWLARSVSSFVLGQESLGFGDVTLMTMIGSFLGWQPMVFVFFLAPFCGILGGLIVKMLFNRPYVPYGPYLSAAAVVVLFGWRWLWLWEPGGDFSVRRFFGDAPGLVILSGASLAAFILLLGLVRLYRLIPGKRA